MSPGAVPRTRSAVRQRIGLIGDSWRTQLWPVPLLGVLTAVALGIGLPRLDGAMTSGVQDALTAYLFSGGPEAARTVLSTIAGSLITVTSLTFSLTVVTLQLASSQFSPRLLRTFTRDRLVHWTLALLLGTFVYALTVLRTVRASLDERSAFVPHLSVTVAYLLGVASVIMLVVFLAHLARQIRVESMLREVHGETTDTMRRLLPDATTAEVVAVTPAPPGTATAVCATSSGFITFVDDDELVRATVAADAVVLVDRAPGDSVVAGTPLGFTWQLASDARLPDPALEQLTGRVTAAVHTGYERTAVQDIGFGLRQLVDVAVKALSPGVNDPTTAIHTLGHVSALLCDIARHRVGSEVRRDDDGNVRVVLRRPGFEAMLDATIAPLARYGSADPDVLARLFMLLREVAWCTTTGDQRGSIAVWLRRLRQTVEREGFDDVERARLEKAEHDVEEAIAGRWAPA